MSPDYAGTDNLEAMEGAVNYQRFLGDLIEQLSRMVHTEYMFLDFGAGTGTYAQRARDLGRTVLCVEIDARLRAQLSQKGFATVAALTDVPSSSVHGIYSFNVLEHIKDDQGALLDLFGITAPDGRLLLYVPAFSILFSAMDSHVGHWRRYRRNELTYRVRAAGFEVLQCFYADSIGFVVSLVYRLLGRRMSGSLSPKNVRLYDKFLFPLSVALDPFLRNHFGKNLVLIARRPPEPTRETSKGSSSDVLEAGPEQL